MSSQHYDHEPLLALIIDPDPTARTCAASVVRQLGGDVIEAADALTGLDLAAQFGHRLRMVIIDIRLPDMDGYDTCLRLQALATQSQRHIPILPFTSTGVMEMLLDVIGCERPCFKPAATAQLDAAVRRALAAPLHESPNTLLWDLAHRHAQAAERAARQERRTRVALLSSATPSRLGLRQLLVGGGARIVAESSSAGLLEQLLERQGRVLLVADARDRLDALALAERQHIPLLLVATTPEQISTLLVDWLLVQDAQGLASVADERAEEVLAAALGALQQGRRFSHLPRQHTTQQRDPLLPRRVAQLLQGEGLTRREQELLWLDSQDRDAAEIAARLRITERSVASYWKRVQRKLRRGRPDVRLWFADQLRRLDEDRPTNERSVGE